MRSVLAGDASVGTVGSCRDRTELRPLDEPGGPGRTGAHAETWRLRDLPNPDSEVSQNRSVVTVNPRCRGQG